MKGLKQIIDELQATNGKKEKEQIIKENLDNREFVEVMKFLLNDFVVTGLSTKKIEKKVVNQFTPVYPLTLQETMTYLKQYNTGSDKDIAIIQQFINNSTEESEQELYKSIVTKSLKFGVSNDTFNKCASKEDQIPVFDVMLAKKYSEYEDKITGDFILTTKLDGSRCVYYNGKFFSRSGLEIDGLEDILDEVKTLKQDYIYDGELLLRNDDNLPSDELFRLSQKESRKKGKKENLQFHIFDMIQAESFMKGKDETSCITRKMLLENEFLGKTFTWLKIVPILYIGRDKTEIDIQLQKVLENKEEGLMLNIATAPYECKRTSNILKVKVMDSCDLKIIGFEKGEGKYSNTLGRINVDYKGYVVGVGSGLTDADRDEIWNNQNKYLGTIVEVQNFGESTSQDGNVSLRFPIFKGFRLDKSEPSYN